MAEPTVQQMIDFSIVREKSLYDSNLQFLNDLDEVGVDHDTQMPDPKRIEVRKGYIWVWKFSWGTFEERLFVPYGRGRFRVTDTTLLSEYFPTK